MSHQSHRYTETLLREILRRQDPPQFGRQYEPAIKPIREEAPGSSRPAWVWSELLQRDVSTLSIPERVVLSIVLRHPALFELQEQRMLPYLPATHPFFGHPLAIGMVLPSFRGTLAIAEELGVLQWHPYITKKSTGNEASVEIPAPWIGDFLLFLKDAIGPYCVNLSVKATREGFIRPQVGITPATNLKRAEQKEIVRQSVEQILYQEIGIPSRCIAADEVDPIVAANLRQILSWQKRKVPFDTQQYDEIVAAFNEGLRAGTTALKIIHRIATSNCCRPYDVKIVMYHAIWRREIRIDLFQYFFVDHPLIPENRDVLEVYDHWFERS
jgi:hypothetical protein